MGFSRKAFGRLLPAEPVASVVNWVNRDFPMGVHPRGLYHPGKKGRSSGLALFLTTDRTSPHRLFVSRERVSEHTRSGGLASEYFTDAGGRLYRDSDLKGVGLGKTIKAIVSRGRRMGKVVAGIRADKIEDRTLGGGDFHVLGLAHLQNLQQDANKSEFFHRNGVRVARHAEHILVKEIIVNGEKISVEEASSRGFIPPGFVPAIALRAYGVRTRTFHLRGATVREVRQMIDDAREFVAAEKGLALRDFTVEHYVKWFSASLGENLGKLHALNNVHSNLLTNITLDSGFVDNGTAVELSGNLLVYGVRSDCRTALDELRDVVLSVNKAYRLHLRVEDLEKQFRAAYNRA